MSSERCSFTNFEKMKLPLYLRRQDVTVKPATNLCMNPSTGRWRHCLDEGGVTGGEIVNVVCEVSMETLELPTCQLGTQSANQQGIVMEMPKQVKTWGNSASQGEHCFYLAKAGQSCDLACFEQLDRGQCDEDALATIAGSVQECRAAVDAFGGLIHSAPAAETVEDSDGTGCVYYEEKMYQAGGSPMRKVQLRRAKGGTSPFCEAFVEGPERQQVHRICACKPPDMDSMRVTGDLDPVNKYYTSGVGNWLVLTLRDGSGEYYHHWKDLIESSFSWEIWFSVHAEAAQAIDEETAIISTMGEEPPFDTDLFSSSHRRRFIGVHITKRGTVKLNLRVGSTQASIATENSIADGRWHHVGVTFSTTFSRARLYVDGTSVRGDVYYTPDFDEPGMDGQVVVGGGSKMRSVEAKLSQLKFWRGELPANAFEMAYFKGICSGWTFKTNMLDLAALFKLDGTLTNSVGHGFHSLVTPAGEMYGLEASCPLNPCLDIVCDAGSRLLKTEEMGKQFKCTGGGGVNSLCSKEQCCKKESKEFVTIGFTFIWEVDAPEKQTTTTKKKKTGTGTLLLETDDDLMPPAYAPPPKWSAVWEGKDSVLTFHSPAGNGLPKALVMRLAPGAQKNTDCIEYGDEVVIAASTNRGRTSDCGWYGCQVAAIDGKQRIVFKPGGESPQTFFVRPSPTNFKASGCLAFGGGFVLAVSEQKRFKQPCGWFGCRVAFIDELHGNSVRLGDGGLQPQIFGARQEDIRLDYFSPGSLHSRPQATSKDKVEITLTWSSVTDTTYKAQQCVKDMVANKVIDNKLANASAVLVDTLVQREWVGGATKVKWRLGEGQENCDQVCGRALGTCNVSYMVDTVKKQFKTAGEFYGEVNIPNLKCRDEVGSSIEPAVLPFVVGPNLDDCRSHAKDEKLAESIDCSADAPLNARRMCACALPTDMGVILDNACTSDAKDSEEDFSGSGSSCAEHCRYLEKEGLGCTAFERMSSGTGAGRCNFRTGALKFTITPGRDCYLNLKSTNLHLSGQIPPPGTPGSLVQDSKPLSSLTAKLTVLVDEDAGQTHQELELSLQNLVVKPLEEDKNQCVETTVDPSKVKVYDIPKVKLPSFCLYDTCHMISVERSGVEDANGLYYPTYPDCTSAQGDPQTPLKLMASEGRGCGGAGHVAIETWDDCQNVARELGVQVGSSGHWPKHPEGCFLNNSVAFFNTPEIVRLERDFVSDAIDCDVWSPMHGGDEYGACICRAIPVGAKDYGKETFGAHWHGYTNTATGATISWIWEDSKFRGWSVIVGGRRVYFDGFNRQLSQQIVLDSFVVRPGHGQEPTPILECQPMNSRARPLMPHGTKVLLELIGRYEFDGKTWYDVADKVAGAFGGCFTIMFTARWMKLNTWSRIFDFGADQSDNNILVANVASTNSLVFAVYDDSMESSLVIDNAIELGRERTWLLTVNEERTMKVWRDGTLMAEKKDVFLPRSIWRPSLYVGRSLWPGDGMFEGSIADLRIWGGSAHGWGEESYLAPNMKIPLNDAAKLAAEADAIDITDAADVDVAY